MRRRRLVLVALGVLLVGAGIVPVWAVREGYVPPWDPHAGCNSMDYGPHTYEELLDLGLSPFCARAYNDETWW